MRVRELARWRLRSLRLTGPGEGTPADVVRRLGAVQSQEYGPAKWSIAMRCRTRVSDAELDRAYADGTILRTHVLRPTWHFVLPEDIRWMLAATGARVQRLNAFVYRQEGCDAALRARACDAIGAALAGGKSLTRKEIGAVLGAAGIPADGLRLSLLVMHAELEAVICSGGLRGRQHTYALLDERAPHARWLDAEQARAELALRYFTGHGPATVKDLAAWASLTVTEVTRALDAVAGQLSSIEVDGRTYWYAEPPPVDPGRAGTRAHLLQTYDEYVMGYTESRYPGRPPSDPAVLLDTEIAGRWKRTGTTVDIVPYARLNENAVRAAADRYARFLGTPVTLRLAPAPP